MKKRISKNTKKEIFVKAPIELVETNTLSGDAKSVYLYLKSKPNWWKFYNSEILEHFKFKKRTLHKILNELTKEGWIQKKQSKKGGKFSGNTYILLNPLTKKPSVKKVHSKDSPSVKKVHSDRVSKKCTLNKIKRNSKIKSKSHYSASQSRSARSEDRITYDVLPDNPNFKKLYKLEIHEKWAQFYWKYSSKLKTIRKDSNINNWIKDMSRLHSAIAKSFGDYKKAEKDISKTLKRYCKDYLPYLFEMKYVPEALSPSAFLKKYDQIQTFFLREDSKNKSNKNTSKSKSTCKSTDRIQEHPFAKQLKRNYSTELNHFENQNDISLVFSQMDLFNEYFMNKRISDLQSRNDDFDSWNEEKRMYEIYKLAYQVDILTYFLWCYNESKSWMDSHSFLAFQVGSKLWRKYLSDHSEFNSINHSEKILSEVEKAEKYALKS